MEGRERMPIPGDISRQRGGGVGMERKRMREVEDAHTRRHLQAEGQGYREGVKAGRDEEKEKAAHHSRALLVGLSCNSIVSAVSSCSGRLAH